MKILFWNLKNHSNEKWVAGIINEYDVDIALFAEHRKTAFKTVIKECKNKYIQHEGYGGCEKITILCKSSIATTVKREQDRYVLYICIIGNTVYNIAGVHLPSPPYCDSNDRKSVIRDLVRDVCEQELKAKNKRTIIIGDFNCNPFDGEVLQKDAFNAVLFKDLIMRKEIINYQGKDRRRFYNPLLHYLSETTKTYGSFYYSSGSAPIIWNSFDQILVRKELADSIENIRFIKAIHGKSLINFTRPNESISDHLPLLVYMKE